MSRHDLASVRPALARWGWLLTAAWLTSACGTSGTYPSAVHAKDDTGFTITERARVGVGVRGDFEDALRLLDQEQYQEGIAALVEVAEESPGLTAPHVDLGIAYGRVGDLEQAEKSLAKALELDPRHPVALNEMGIVYRRTGRFQEARASYEKALALYPGFHFARRNLAILCDVYLVDPGCALEHYELYRQAVPDDESVGMWIADLRARSGR